MAFHIGRPLMFCAIFLLLARISEARPQNEIKADTDLIINEGTAKQSDEENSSSEETEHSDEVPVPSRRRRSADSSAPASGRAAIPGLPDPATVIKIAELFQTLGEKIVPILIEAILPGSVADGERFGRDLKFLKSFKRSLDLYSDELQMS